MFLLQRMRWWRHGLTAAAVCAAGAISVAHARPVARTTSARTSVHASQVNVTRNVNVVHHHDRWGHPVAAAAAVTATAVAVGTIVASLPPSCSAMVVGGVTYQNCGGVFYQPVYQGTAVQYVVVNGPR